MRKENGVLSSVTDYDLKLLETNPKKFWRGVTEIGYSAFYGCSGLTSITIPSNVTKIGGSAFSGCKGLTSITIPDSVTEIGGGAFYGCSGLTSITIPDSVTKIGDYAFYGCSGLTSITIPDTVTEIGRSAFSGCRCLTSITIPSNVTKIGGSAFSGCSGLTSITIPDSVTEIGESAFLNCKGLTSITIPNGVTSIEEYAFSGCKGLTSITIPDSVTEIRSCAFLGCRGLKEIEVDADNKNYSSEDGVLYNKDKTKILDCPKGKSLITIPDSVTEIGDYAFSGCSGLTSITIPDSVTEIEAFAFSGCTGLTSITIPDSVTEIGGSAFSGCDRAIVTYKNFRLPAKFLDRNGSFEKLKNITDEKEKRFAQQCFNNNLDYLSFSDREKVGNDDLNWKPWQTLLKNVNLEWVSEGDINDLFVFAKALGLFDRDEKMEIKGPNSKNMVKVSDVAYNFLQKFVKDVSISHMHMFMQGIQNNGVCQEFLRFISNKTNYDDVISQMKKPGQEDFLTKVYEWFVERRDLTLGEVERDDNTTAIPTSEENRYKIRTYQTTETGIDKTRWKVPTVELLVKEFETNKFSGIYSNRDREIAEHFSKVSDYQQKHFDKAKEIDKEREQSQVPDFIVGKKVSQNLTQAYMEYLRYVGEVEKEIVKDATEIIANQKDVSNRIFTYEALAKSDIANFTIGYMTSCCARLYGAGAGAMRGAIIDPDMQPLVVRDNRGEIVAYSILYINREKGYAVLNDIEVNRKYTGDEESLKIIYEKMRRNAIENIEAYNESAERPVDFINSGLSPNWSAVNDYITKNSKSTVLYAPDFNNYKYAGSGSWAGDWHRSQYTIWQRNENEEGRSE